ncbi:MAG: metallopeptidase TldD-related protein [Turneriella sp.]|nr:metallopeptidase TldD-related protein [Turneriella sp.]
MKSLATLLRKTAGLRGWQLSQLTRRSQEAYWVMGKAETVRCNTVHNYKLLVQTPVDAMTMGESSTCFQSWSAPLRTLVEESIERAKLVRNPCYDFCAPWQKTEDDSRILDPQVWDATLDSVLHYGEDLHEFCRKELSGFTLNSLELFFEDFSYTITNHRGLDLAADSTRVVADYALTAPDDQHEVVVLQKRRFLEDLKLKEQLAADAQVLSALERAELPPTGEFPVVLAEEALDTLFDFFLAQLDGHALFNQYSIFKKGDSVLPEAIEEWDISSTPFLHGGMRSYAFDELGFPMRKVTLVKKNQVENFLIDGRHAGLLQQPHTSALANVEVSCGDVPYQDFLEDGVLELLKFSTFRPNPVSGAFSGEIRFGYFHRHGKKIPVRGGSVSGTTLAAFTRARKAAERVQRARYYGPKGIFFTALTVAGQ